MIVFLYHITTSFTEKRREREREMSSRSSKQPLYPNIQDEIAHLKQLLNLPFSMEVIILISWAIWTTRNDLIFQSILASLYTCRCKFKVEMKWITYRVKRKRIQWAGRLGQYLQMITTFVFVVFVVSVVLISLFCCFFALGPV